MWLTLMDTQKKRKLATTANQYFRILQFHWKESRTQEPIGKAGEVFFFFFFLIIVFGSDKNLRTLNSTKFHFAFNVSCVRDRVACTLDKWNCQRVQWSFTLSSRKAREWPFDTDFF